MTEIKGITSDSRAVKAGYIFAALQGVKVDGRDYMAAAVDKGATHILAQTGTDFPTGVTGIESDNPRQDYARMAAEFYDAQPENTIAVTGTNGKTSVADFCRQILDHAGRDAASLGTLGVVSNHINADFGMTTPDPATLHALLADMKAAGINDLAMEASSHGLDQYRLDGVNIKVAAFTNLTQDHLDYHETMDDYFAAKARLFHDLLPTDGIAVVNADDAWAKKITFKNMMSYGMDKNATLRLLSQLPTISGQDIDVQYDGKKYAVHLPLIGKFQAYNVLCAAACCIAIGLDANKVFKILPRLNGVRGRMELASAITGYAAYIDYAHTPDALINALTSLRPHVRGKLVCVFGAGGDRDKTKRPLMGGAACDHADICIITDDNPRSEDPSFIRNQIFSACSKAENIGGRANAIAHAVSLLNAGDVLLVAGKGHEQGQTIGDTTHPFDDLLVTRQAMEARFKK